MRDWLHNLPVVWMTLAAFVATYLLAGMIFAGVNLLARGERARVFKSISPGMLPPLGILFGLFVAFTAAQVWSDIDRANAGVRVGRAQHGGVLEAGQGGEIVDEPRTTAEQRLIFRARDGRADPMP